TANFVGSGSGMIFISGHVINSARGNALAGVTIRLTGSQTSSTTTDSNGIYSFSVNPGGTFTVTPAFRGFVFAPPSLPLANVTANQTADFVGTQQASAATPVGSNVTVQLEDVTLNFANVSGAGTTTLRHIGLAAAGTPPAGYVFIGNDAIDISTTAT